MQEKSFSLLATDSGPKGLLRFSSLLSFIEEISISDTISKGLPKEKTLERGFLWVISRIYIEVKDIPSYDDRLSFSSRSLATIRNLFMRDYLLKDIKGNRLIEAKAIWTLISSKSRKPIDVEKEKISIEPDVDESFFIQTPRPDKDSLICSKKRIVGFSDLDINSHMTNTHYADWLMDIDPTLFGKGRKITLSFLKELSLGEEVQIQEYEDPRGRFCDFISKGSIVFSFSSLN